MHNEEKKILLAGGGTLGSVSPLLAIAKKYPAEYLFLGSEHGPERKFVVKQEINFKPIRSGKLRRYFSFKNLLDIFQIKLAFFQSLKILSKFKPDIILTAGSFVAVPVAWAGWILRIPVIVHQQDIKVGLANNLMAPFAKKITTLFPEQEKDFKRSKVVITGNPIRRFTEVIDDRPIVVITGGGIGARGLNEFIKPFIPKLLEKYEVHHVLGKNNWDQRLEVKGYFAYKMVVDGMLSLLSRADIIISRAGISNRWYGQGSI